MERRTGKIFKMGIRSGERPRYLVREVLQREKMRGRVGRRAGGEAGRGWEKHTCAFRGDEEKSGKREETIEMGKGKESVLQK